MAPDSTASSADDREPVHDSTLLINASIGGSVGIVFSFVLFSPVIGGGVAGYLEGTDTRDGLLTGAVSGLIMLIPLIFIGFFIAVLMVGMVGGPVYLLGFFGSFVLLLVALYTVGLGALGGFLGAYIRREL